MSAEAERVFALRSFQRSQSTGRLGFVLSGFLFKVTLDIAYLTYLSDAYATHFLTAFQVNFSVLQYIESFFWLGAVLLLVKFSSRSAGGIAFFTAIVFLLAPLASMYGMDSERTRDALVLAVVAILIAHLVSVLVVGPRVKISLVKSGERYLVFLSFLLIAVFLAVAVLSGALFQMNFDIDKVYDFRTELGAKVDVGVLTYTNLWTQKVFTPLLLALGLQRKSMWLIAFALTMHLIYFGVTQHRMHLFAPLLVFGAYALYRREFTFARGFILVSVAVLVVNLMVTLLELEVLGALIIRRAFFVGASVAYTWVEYFADNPKVFFADKLLASIVQNEYSNTNLPMFMGDYMREGLDIGFNVGVVGAGFAQLGILGVILYGALIGAIVRINQRLIDLGVPSYLQAAILFLPYRTVWADSDTLTALLSHGLFVGTLAVWLFGSPRKKIASSASSCASVDRRAGSAGV